LRWGLNGAILSFERGGNLRAMGIRDFSIGLEGSEKGKALLAEGSVKSGDRNSCEKKGEHPGPGRQRSCEASGKKALGGNVNAQVSGRRMLVPLLRGQSPIVQGSNA